MRGVRPLGTRALRGLTPWYTGIAAMLTLFVAAVPAGCGGAREPQATLEPIVRLDTGGGPRGAAVLRPARPGRLPVIVFLHGYQAISPRFYDEWLEHLVRQGNVVVYPRYQTVASLPSVFLRNALPGVRAGLALTPVDPGTLVVAGHSAGGALSSDYAAAAARAGLPPPRAIYAVQPGRGLGLPLTIPRVDPRRIAASTRLVALAGADDRVVGTREARLAVRLATRIPPARKRYVLVTDRRADDHGAPLRDEAAARRAYWAPLDRLIRSARRPG
jgi:dienelactone hydrolase